jgi:hypothetical protein
MTTVSASDGKLTPYHRACDSSMIQTGGMKGQDLPAGRRRIEKVLVYSRNNEAFEDGAANVLHRQRT